VVKGRKGHGRRQSWEEMKPPEGGGQVRRQRDDDECQTFARLASSLSSNNYQRKCLCIMLRLGACERHTEDTGQKTDGWFTVICKTVAPSQEIHNGIRATAHSHTGPQRGHNATKEPQKGTKKTHKW